MAQYCSVYDKFHVERNILVRKVLKDIDDESLIEYFNKAEFDLVLYSIDSFGNRIPYLVIELNGGEHYTSHSRTIINDKKKMEICEKKNIKYLSIPNSYSKSYDTLFDLISTLDIDYDDKKNTLFDLEE